MPAPISPENHRHILALRASGVSCAKIAEQLSLSQNTVGRYSRKPAPPLDGDVLTTADVRSFRRILAGIPKHADCWSCTKTIYLWTEQQLGECHHCGAPWLLSRTDKPARKDGRVEITGTYRRIGFPY